jgi:hypothetical protein
MIDEGKNEIKLGLFNGFLEFIFKNHEDFIIVKNKLESLYKS